MREENSNLNHEAFKRIRNKLFAAFNKHGLSYKIIGGTVMNYLDDTRGTSDLDMTIKQNMIDVYKFVDALVECNYGSKQDILDSIFGADPQTEDYLFALSRITSDNFEYAGFYIDLIFDFGEINYNDIEAREVNVNGMQVVMATISQMFKLKRGIDEPLDKDLRDITFLKKLLEEEEGNFTSSSHF